MGKFLATVRPRINTAIATAYSANDLLFDWHRFEVPEGEACIKNFNIIMPGTNGDASSAENVIDFTFFIARSVNGEAPPSLGTANTATNNAAGKIAFAGCRNHLVYTQTVDASLMASAATYTQGYTIFTSATMNTAAATQAAQVANALQPEGVNIGNSKYPGNYNDSTVNPSHSSFWIAGITHGAHDFGTGIALNQASNQAAVALSTSSETTLITDGTDADDVLSVGDELIAADGAKIGKVTKIVDANTIKVDHVEEALSDDDEICVRNPIIFNFGIEY
jgi:hypothetical protein